jgi:hypothetical protein
MKGGLSRFFLDVTDIEHHFPGETPLGRVGAMAET